MQNDKLLQRLSTRWWFNLNLNEALTFHAFIQNKIITNFLIALIKVVTVLLTYFNWAHRSHRERETLLLVLSLSHETPVRRSNNGIIMNNDIIKCFVFERPEQQQKKKKIIIIGANTKTIFNGRWCVAGKFICCQSWKKNGGYFYLWCDGMHIYWCCCCYCCCWLLQQEFKCCDYVCHNSMYRVINIFWEQRQTTLSLYFSCFRHALTFSYHIRTHITNIKLWKIILPIGRTLYFITFVVFHLTFGLNNTPTEQQHHHHHHQHYQLVFQI